MAPEEEVVRAGEAARVLDSRIFREAKDRILSGIQAQMRTVPLADQTMHTRLILLLQCWQSIEGYLEQVKETGKLAEFQIEEERKRRRFWSV